jgi:hypothetical protein
VMVSLLLFMITYTALVVVGLSTIISQVKTFFIIKEIFAPDEIGLICLIMI